MAHTDNVPDAHLEKVADELGELTGTPQFFETNLMLDDAGGEPEMQIRETLQLWAITAEGVDAAVAGHLDVADVADFTGRLHHQLRGTGPAAFARSLARDPNNEAGHQGPVLKQFARSSLADQIDAAVDWIDHNVAGDPVVRLLTVPSHQVYALWLYDEGTHESKVYVLSGPDKLAAPRDRAISSTDFFTALEPLGSVAGFMTDA